MLLGKIFLGMHPFADVVDGCEHDQYITVAVAVERGVAQNFGAGLVPVSDTTL